MSRPLASRVRRRQAGFLGLVLACVALVEAKSMTAPPTHRISLGSQSPSGLGKLPATSPQVRARYNPAKVAAQNAYRDVERGLIR